MDRAILLAAGLAWAVAGIAGLGVAVAGVDALRTVLPPLGIDEASLGRTVAALATGVLALGIGHLGVVAALGQGRAWAESAGILLAGVAGAAFGALAAAALTAGAAGSLVPLAAIGAAAGCAGLALLYGLVGWTLVRRLRHRSTS